MDATRQCSNKLGIALAAPSALWGNAPMCLERGAFLEIPDNLVSVCTSVASARDVNPEVLTVGGLHEQLIKIAVVLNPVEPAIMVHD